MRDGGSIGRISSTSSVCTDTFYLSDMKDVPSFERGMLLESSPTDGTGGMVRCGSALVVDVDRDTGTIFLVAPLNREAP